GVTRRFFAKRQSRRAVLGTAPAGVSAAQHERTNFPMLDALRRGSTGWVAKILFALLVLSFAVWGVADVFTGFGRGAIAKVGSHEIRVEDFQRAYQNEIALIS